jgi:hypothetical protein
MIWVLSAAFGSAAWLSIALLFLALCRAAGRADAVSEAHLAGEKPLRLLSGIAPAESGRLRAIQGHPAPRDRSRRNGRGRNRPRRSASSGARRRRTCSEYA